MKDGMMMTMTLRGTPYFMAQEVFEERYGYESDIWSVGCVAIQMATGVPPWKELGINNPVLLYNHIKSHPGPPPFAILNQKESDVAAFTSMVKKCFHKSPGERPDAKQLKEDPFFLHRECSSDDDQTGVSITSSFFSPRKDSSAAWEHLLSPATPQSHSVGRRGQGRPRRSSSAGCLKSSFLSPPIPEHTVMNMAYVRHQKSPVLSPQYDPSDWPSWARKQNLKSEGGKNLRVSGIKRSPSVEAICSTMDSLAISDESSFASLNRRNLFCNGTRDNTNNNNTKNSGYFSEVSEATGTISTLCGENLLDSV